VSQAQRACCAAGGREAQWRRGSCQLLTCW
jgi:hypothetical protein